jgi:acetyl esterase/lipase
LLNVRYSNESVDDERLLSLDIYRTDQSNLPVMIYVHGGGWYRGAKSNVNEKPKAFNERGFVFVSVNYRLYPEASISTQMSDVASAIAWVKNNIAAYGGDSQRLFLYGHSAGAHLVSLVATDASYLAAHGMTPADIKGVIALDTQAYDLVALLENLPETNGGVYRTVFGDNPEDWKKYSPIAHVAADKDIPPFFLVYTGEKPGRSEITELFADALEKAGISATLFPAVEKTHGQVNSQFGLPGNALTEATFEWLKKILDGL